MPIPCLYQISDMKNPEGISAHSGKDIIPQREIKVLWEEGTGITKSKKEKRVKGLRQKCVHCRDE